jgi:hypothetical protein
VVPATPRSWISAAAAATILARVCSPLGVSLTADGDAEWVTDDAPAILGRPARSFGQFAADFATAFS